MRRLAISALASVSAIACITFAGTAFAGTVPRQSPEFAIQMPDGGQTLLSSYKGKVVVLAFLFTT